MLVFDPLRPDANGFSYNDIMIMPLIRASAAALNKRRGAKAGRKTLWFGMQGEVRSASARGGSSWWRRQESTRQRAGMLRRMGHRNDAGRHCGGLCRAAST